MMSIPKIGCNGCEYLIIVGYSQLGFGSATTPIAACSLSRFRCVNDPICYDYPERTRPGRLNNGVQPTAELAGRENVAADPTIARQPAAADA